MSADDPTPTPGPENAVEGVRTPERWVVCGGCQRYRCLKDGQDYCSATCRARAWRRTHPTLGSRQKALFDVGPQFDGETYDAEKDQDRLGRQLRAVKALMVTGRWWTLAELAVKVGASEASVSARIRDLRKERFGGHTIERRRVKGGNGLHEYRMEGTK